MFGKPLHLFIYSAVLLLIIMPLLQQGLFIDGLLYKTVSLNYGRGEAGFWGMKFSNTSMNPFYEQPPFFFFLNGLYFKMAGHSFLADKFYTILLLLISLYLLSRITRQLTGLLQSGIVSILLFISIPVVCWSYQNQVIETLVLPLSLFTFLVFLGYRKLNNILDQIFFVIVSVHLLLLLFLTKGFQSCFVLVAPFAFFVFLRERKMLWFGLITGSLFGLVLYVLLFQHPASSAWFKQYLDKRLIASLEGVGATTTYKAEIIIRIFTELIPVFALLFLSWIFFRKKIQSPESHDRKLAKAILVIAIAGSFPFAITLEQRGFYLVPSMAFYILALSVYFKKSLALACQSVESFFQTRIVSLSTLAIFLGSLCLCVFAPSQFKRDENRLHDLAKILPLLKEGDTVLVSDDSWNDVALQAYLYMNKRVSVKGTGVFHDEAEKQNFLAYIKSRGEKKAELGNENFYIYDREHASLPLDGFTRIELPVKQYELFRRIPAGTKQ